MAATPMHQSLNSGAERVLMRVVSSLFARPAEQGALPILFAAGAPHATPGVFIGPTGPRQRTKIALDDVVGPGTDERAAARLWGVSEELTGIRYLTP